MVCRHCAAFLRPTDRIFVRHSTKLGTGRKEVDMFPVAFTTEIYVLTGCLKNRGKFIAGSRISVALEVDRFLARFVLFSLRLRGFEGPARLPSAWSWGDSVTHYSLDQWVDFARHQVDSESAAQMQRHLDGGCAVCAEVLATWRRVMEAAGVDAGLQVPEEIVAAAKEYYHSRWRVRRLRSFGEVKKGGGSGLRCGLQAPKEIVPATKKDYHSPRFKLTAGKDHCAHPTRIGTRRKSPSPSFLLSFFSVKFRSMMGRDL